MSASLPLLAMDDAGAALFLTSGEAFSRGRFVAAAASLAQRLPASGIILNLCDNRYAFSVALAAAALRGGSSLLPPSTAISALQDLGDEYPEAPIVSESPPPGGIQVALEAPPQQAAAAPSLPADQVVAIAFTSGSSGKPQAHAKTWKALHHVGAQLSQRLLPGLGSCTIVATVPAQHMYGMEATVMLPLVGGHVVATGRPTFPDDIRTALERVPAPRVLVTTPVHIRTLLAAGTRLPALACIISATAPLPLELAAKAESTWTTVVREIYGCSEAGTIGTRRTVDGDLWRLIDGVRVEQHDGICLLHGEHLAQPVPLQDVLEIDDGGVRLLGRASDMVKVAGKRASLADLTLKLLSIPGVLDGVVFQPDAEDEAALLRRPAALVVAPGLSENEILGALGRMVDPVFLPRPLRKLKQLPRNPVGKLPRGDLQKLLADG